MPAPPDALERAVMEYFEHILEPLYWSFFLASFLGYLILRWQRREGEFFPAVTLRWLTLAKAIFWFSLCVGRVIGDWALILWSFTATYAGIMAIVWLVSLYTGYVRPARKLREINRSAAEATLPPRNDLRSTL